MRLLSFLRARKGSVTLNFALLLPAMLLFTGGGVELMRMERARQAVQSAADAAVLSATRSLLTKVGKPWPQGERVLYGNIADDAGITIKSVSTGSDGVGQADIRVKATVETVFLKNIFGRDLEVEVYSEAQFREPPDQHFIFAIDSSQSMLFGATEDDIKKLEQTQGCAFACHTSNNKNDRYIKALNAGIRTRIEAAKDAVSGAVDLMVSSHAIDHSDIYLDLYDFALHMDHRESNFLLRNAGSATAFNNKVDAIVPDFLPKHPTYKYALSWIEEAFDDINDDIKALPGKDTRERTVFIVTDGLSHVTTTRTSRRRRTSAVDPQWCQGFKDQGVRVAVLYTTYFHFPSNKAWRNLVRPHDAKLGPNLRDCASPGWYYEVQHEEELRAALFDLVTRALPSPVLTQ